MLKIKGLAAEDLNGFLDEGTEVAGELRFRDVIQLAREREYKDGGSDEVKGSLDHLREPKTALIFAGLPLVTPPVRPRGMMVTL